jgi:hypothetical protein
MKKLLSFAALVIFAGLGHAQDTTGKFLRINKEGLQTANATYEKDGVSVTLYSAIHIGDKDYYKALNKKMAECDSLCYELVAPPGTTPERGKGSMMGAMAKLMLELDHQTERIDYKRPNFVHADLSFEQMKEVMAKRGETPLILGLRVIADSLQQKNLAEKNPIPAIAHGIELSGASTPLELKRAFSKILVKQVDEGTVASLKVVLIGDRNTRAMEVFEEQVKAGKKKIGIFYGAAHMSDFDSRLRALGYKRTGSEWLTAWDLTDD